MYAMCVDHVWCPVNPTFEKMNAGHFILDVETVVPVIETVLDDGEEENDANNHGRPADMGNAMDDDMTAPYWLQKKMTFLTNA